MLKKYHVKYRLDTKLPDEEVECDGKKTGANWIVFARDGENILQVPADSVARISLVSTETGGSNSLIREVRHVG